MIRGCVNLVQRTFGVAKNQIRGLASMENKRRFQNPFPDDHGEAGVSKEDLKAWIDQVSDVIKKNAAHTERDCDGSLYVGPAGLGFAFYVKATTMDLNPAQKMEELTFAKAMVDMNLSFAQNRRMSPGFLLGSSGLYAVGAAIEHALGNRDKCQEYCQKFREMANIFSPVTVYNYGSDELLVGRSGYICGALWLNQELNQQIVPLEVLHQLCKVTVESGRLYAAKTKSPCPLMYAYHGTEYLGAAHGLSSILQMLLSVTDFYQNADDQSKSLIFNSCQFLLNLQTPDGNFPCAMDEIGPRSRRHPDDDLVHWCHGAPGTVYLMEQAAEVFGDHNYQTSALKCGDCVWKSGLLKKGPGICHGVSGSGYVFLSLSKYDRLYYEKALLFAKFMESEEFKRKARQPDCPLSLYEGLAGKLCFLIGLLHPSKPLSRFPFF